MEKLPVDEQMKQSFYDKACKYVSREAEENIVDAILCTFHNEGYALDGNTAQTDVEWFARILFDRRKQFSVPHWDNLDEDTRNMWLERSQDAIDLLPRMDRIAHRTIHISQGLRTIAQEQKHLKTIRKK